jgi:hypothetical protein
MQPFAVAVYEVGHSGFIPWFVALPFAFRRLRQPGGNAVPSVLLSVLRCWAGGADAFSRM